MARREYDLTRRVSVGGARRYRCGELLNILDDAGRPAIRQRRTAELREEILSVGAGGTPTVRWSWTAFKCDVERNYAEDEFGLRQPVKQFWEAKPSELLPESGEIVVEGATERSDVFYPDTDRFGLSKTIPAAFMTAELCLHTRQFSMIATRTHGGIDQLHGVGDAARMRFSGREDHARNGEMFDATITRGENRISFEAVTTRHDREVALLRYNAPYEVTCPGWGPTHCEQVGLMWIEIETGWLVGGDHYQTNYMSGVPLLPGGKHLPINVRFETSLELIP
jgi:hypothetical protein